MANIFFDGTVFPSTVDFIDILINGTTTATTDLAINSDQHTHSNYIPIHTHIDKFDPYNKTGVLKIATNDTIETPTNQLTIYDMIKEIIFNDPATIIKWHDGTKTVVKAWDEPFDKEKGLAMAITKYVFGNKSNFNDKMREFID